ncbi:DNA polymerase epsilon subunit B [Ostertagia ostertagi]
MLKVEEGKKLVKELKKNLDQVVAASSSKPKRAAFGERPVNQLTFDLSCIEAEDSSNEDFGSTNLTGVYRAFAPVLPSPSNAKYQARAERFVITQQVQGQLFVKSSAPCGPVFIEMPSATPSEKYAVDKASNVIDVECERMAQFATQCREANPEISEWSTPVPGSSGSDFVYGQIVRSISEDVPLSDRTASLLMDDERGTVIQLDLSRLPEIGIYPGQLVALLGSFEGGDHFIATRQFHPKPLPLSPLERPTVDENLRVWCASGPFTTSENCSYEPLRDLLEIVTKEQPHVLILMGPLVESKNAFMQRKEFPEKYQSVMDQLMRNIAKCLEGCRTEVIVQPAPFRDACCDPIFPTPPFKFSSDISKKMGRRLHCAPEPCVARINGVEVAFTSSEVIVHLSKNEWHRSPNQENQDRITRLNSHLLDQRSLYPLSPPAIPSSVEELTKLCSLRTAPHVIICSSVLAASIKNINNTIVANPGITARGGSGTFLKCEFSTSVAQDASNLPDCSRFEIVKL